MSKLLQSSKSIYFYLHLKVGVERLIFKEISRNPVISTASEYKHVYIHKEDKYSSSGTPSHELKLLSI